MKATRGVFAAILEGSPPAILLLQRAGKPDGTGYPGQWELPGGKTEEGETDEDCLAREAYEETGLVVSSLGEVSQILLSAPAGIVSAAPDEAVVHLCQALEGHTVNLSSDHLQAHWTTLEEIFSGKVKILTNPTSKGYVSRMARMVLAGFAAHQKS